MRKWERAREDSYNVTLKQQLIEAEKREKAEAETRSKKHAEMAILIQEQIAECQEVCVERLRSEKRDGELVKKKAEDDLQRDAELQAEKALKARLQVSVVAFTLATHPAHDSTHLVPSSYTPHVVQYIVGPHHTPYTPGGGDATCKPEAQAAQAHP